MDPRDRRLPAALLAVTLVWCLMLAALGAHEAFLFLVPALLLAAPLAVRIYPGEDALHALAAIPARPARRLRRPLFPRSRDESLMPRGARLLANSLAKRPPPLPVPAL